MQLDGENGDEIDNNSGNLKQRNSDGVRGRGESRQLEKLNPLEASSWSSRDDVKAKRCRRKEQRKDEEHKALVQLKGFKNMKAGKVHTEPETSPLANFLIHDSYFSTH
ncbi:hypothetical protein ACFE04_016626 [Oxalis oulophora]